MSGARRESQSSRNDARREYGVVWEAVSPLLAGDGLKRARHDVDVLVAHVIAKVYGEGEIGKKSDYMRYVESNSTTSDNDPKKHHHHDQR